jgi:dihydroflavonol-4-reductase
MAANGDQDVQERTGRFQKTAMLKILVTGANGFLAGNIIIELLRRGYHVRGMLRKKAVLITEHPDLEAFYGDITRPDDVIDAAGGCSAIIHSAAVTDHSIRDYDIYRQVNVEATRNVLNACIRHSIKKFIYVSTANVFGFGSKEAPGNEDVPMMYPFTESMYAVSKATAQNMVKEMLRDSRTNFTIVNPAFMIGPNDGKISSNQIILRAVNKKIVFIPPGGKNFIHVSDAATAICNTLEVRETGACYLLANENLTYREFYKKMAAVTNCRQLLITFPRWLLLFAGLTGNILRYAGISTAVSLTNMKIISIGNYYSGRKAKISLNLSPKPIEEAIREAIEWFKVKEEIKS